MVVIKQNYTRPKPVLYLYRGMPSTSLVSNDFDTAKSITVNTKTNEVATLSFSIPFTLDRKISYDDCEKLVKFEGEYYIIKNIQVEDNTTGSIKVTCEHESTELKGIYCTYINLVGATPQTMFQTITTSTMHPIDVGYKWAGTDVDLTKKRHLQTDTETSVYENLVTMAKVFNGWLEFYTDDAEQKWVFLRTKPIDNGKFVKKNLDMKSLNITYSSEEIFTRLYPLGAVNETTGYELNIMDVNPTKKSYLENYSYYLAKGIPASVIDKEAKYQQLKTMREDSYTDANDLLAYAQEELARCSVPQLEATLEMEDLSVYVDSLDEPPKVGYKMTCINPDIDFVLGCQITEVERNYDNPLETKVTISNVIRYNTVYQSIEHSANNADQVTAGGGTGTYVPAVKVLDGDHLNVVMKMGNISSEVQQQADHIGLIVKDVSGAVSRIDVAEGKITSLVTDMYGNTGKIQLMANSVTSLVTDMYGNTGKVQVMSTSVTNLVTDMYGNSGKIKVMAGEIDSKVDEGDFGSLIEQHPNSVKISFNKISDYAEINSSDGLILGDKSSGTYSKIGYDGRVEFMMNGAAYPYRSLVYVGAKSITCSDTVDYTSSSVPLPSMFDDIPESQIKCIVSVKKVYDSNLSGGLNMPYWFGAYGSISGGYLDLEVMSCYRKVIYDGNDNSDWVANFGSPRAGRIDVAYIIVA